MEQDQPNDPPITSDPKPVLQYYTYVPSDVRLVTIRRISAMEAQLAQTKLESEGIRSFIADAHMSTMHPVMMGTAQLQVA